MTTNVDIRGKADEELLRRVKRMSPEARNQLALLTTPRLVEPFCVHIPHPKQQFFLSLSGQEVMYGGSAGGGKSDALLMAAAQYVDVPGYSALILRRTWPDLNSPGAILDRAKQWWGQMEGVRTQDGGRIFNFPSGARIHFGYIMRENDKYKFQSAEYQFIGFDELTHFTESQYLYLFSRLRRPTVSCLNCAGALKFDVETNKWKHTELDGKCRNVYPDPMVLDQYAPTVPGGPTVFNIPLRMRSATNPGGIGHEWVRTRFIDPKTRDKDAIFVPAALRDNPSLDRESYVQNLMHLNVIDRSRLLEGDWDVYDHGDYFAREMFPVLPFYTPGPRDRLVRYWDRAATEGGGDYTVGTKLALTDNGEWIVMDVVRGQWSSLGNEKMIARTAMSDGRDVPIRMEQEPGSSGKDVIDHYKRRVLYGFNFAGIKSSGSKEDRARPISSAAEAQLVKIVAAQWNREWLDELSLFPKGAHDDQVDSLSGASNWLALARRSRLLA